MNCVRWNPEGTLLATASDDNTVKLMDFASEKVLFTGGTSDKSNESTSLVISLIYMDRPSRLRELLKTLNILINV